MVLLEWFNKKCSITTNLYFPSFFVFITTTSQVLNQLKTFFEAIGYHQVPSKSIGLPEDFLFFINEKIGMTISFEKSNEMSIYLVRHILKRAGYTYEYFVKVFYKDRNNKEESS